MKNEIDKIIRRIVLAGIIGIPVIWLVYRIGDITHWIYSTISEGEMLLYYGSLLAGLCIFFSLKITIQYQSNQQQLNKINEFRPFIALENKTTGTSYIKSYYLENAKDSECSFQIYINNIAKYPAINFCIKFSIDDTAYDLILDSEKDNGKSFTLLRNHQDYQFAVVININKNQLDDYINNKTLCSILFEFNDLIKNKYEQKYDIVFKNIVNSNIAIFEILGVNEPELKNDSSE